MSRDTVDVVLEMAAESRQNHATLVEKVDKGFATVLAGAASHELHDVQRFADIDRRLTPIETTRTTLRWVIGSGFVAGLGLLVDIVVNHLAHR